MIWGKKPAAFDIMTLAFKGSDAVADIRNKYDYNGALLAQFAQDDGPLIHKWHHYVPLYDRYFGPWRGKPVRFLEIGVSHGGSLQMWRKFFGEDAIIFGIDIDPACAVFDGKDAQVRIGSQDDPAFLTSVINEMGGVDIVLDDGSHQMTHIRKSLAILFPKLEIGGLYFIEDLHTAFWDNFGGGVDAKSNFFNDIRSMIDDMHHWYHSKPIMRPDLVDWVSGIHLHDSIVVLEKEKVLPPTHSQIGKARS